MTTAADSPSTGRGGAGVTRITHWAIGVWRGAALLGLTCLLVDLTLHQDTLFQTQRQHLIFYAVLSLWLFSLSVRGRLPRITPFTLPLLLLLASQAAAAVLAVDRRLSVELVLTPLTAVLLLAAFADLPGLTPGILGRALTFMAFVLAVLALRDEMGQWQAWVRLAQSVEGHTVRTLLPPTVPRVVNVGFGPTVLAILLTLAVPFYIRDLVVSRRSIRVLAAVALLIVELAIFFTLARGAWAAQAAALVVCCGGFFASGRYSLPSSRRSRQAAIAALALGLVLAVAFLKHYHPRWLYRPTLTGHTQALIVGLRIFWHHPWLGAGPGSFPFLYQLERGTNPWGAAHSHNVIIQIAADSGIIGVSAAAVLALSVAISLWRLWQQGDAGQRSWAVVVAASLTAFAVNGISDAFQLSGEVLVVLALLLALAVRSARANPCTEGLALTWLAGRRIPAWSGPLHAIVVLILGISLAVAWGYSDRAEAYWQRSLVLAQGYQWQAAAVEATRAAALDSTMAIYHVQAGMAFEQAWEADGQADDGTHAIQELRRALELEPRSDVTRLDLAIVLSKVPCPAQPAEDCDREAAGLVSDVGRYAGHDWFLLTARAVMLEQLQPDAAVAAYAWVLTLNPALTDSPFWRATAFRRENFAAIVDRAEAQVRDGAEREAIHERASRTSQRLALAAAGDPAAPQLEPAGAGQPGTPSAQQASASGEGADGVRAATRRRWLEAAYLDLENPTAIDQLGNSFAPTAIPCSVITLGARTLGVVQFSPLELIYEHYFFGFHHHVPQRMIANGDWLHALPTEVDTLSADLDRWRAATACR